MKRISLLIKPASSSCNLRCRYCFYRDISEHRNHNNYGMMQEAVMQKVIQAVFDDIDEDGIITFAFQGGEPTLIGRSFYEQFVHEVAKYQTHQQVQYAIQSNGVGMDEAWFTFFKQYDVLVGISLDGYESNHDYYRYDPKHKGTYAKVIKTIRCLQKENIRYNILCVLSERLAKHPKALYQFFRKQKFAYIQFIPCLDHLEHHHEDTLRPESFYAFYHTYFQLWYKDAIQGIYQSVTLFDNLLLMLQDQPPYQCGMLGFCSMQNVVEANGAIYPCDFYVLDRYECGNLMQDSLQQIREKPILQAFLNEEKTISPLCIHCPTRNLCHGGCRYMNHTFLSSSFCAMQKLMEEMIPCMIKLLKISDSIHR